MKTSAYEQRTREFAEYPDATRGTLPAVAYCALGLGEAGKVQNKVKKILRGDTTLRSAAPSILDELGDTLWYVTRLADELGCDLEELMSRNVAKLTGRKERGLIKGAGDRR